MEFENVRQVLWGLILSVVYIAIAGVVAFIDPFNNGTPWVTWLTLAAVAVVAVACATVITVLAEDDAEFWATLAVSVIGWMLVAALIVGMMTTVADGLKPEYHSLAWTVYGVPFVALPVAALVQYLAAAAGHRRDASSHLRRVA